MTRWTEEDRQRAKAMRASGMKLREVAAHFPGRTAYHIANMLNPQRKARVDFNDITRAILESLGDAMRPPDYLVAEAVRRAFYPRTPTMRVCGDPVLNQSAFFRQQHGERL
jgi:hypothetical protein